jgi:hypothetical protein
MTDEKKPKNQKELIPHLKMNEELFIQADKKKMRFKIVPSSMLDIHMNRMPKLRRMPDND